MDCDVPGEADFADRLQKARGVALVRSGKQSLNVSEIEFNMDWVMKGWALDWHSVLIAVPGTPLSLETHSRIETMQVKRDSLSEICESNVLDSLAFVSEASRNQVRPNPGPSHCPSRTIYPVTMLQGTHVNE
ncbi:uncharacterized protein BCR38DRAFT_410830 [Pseudomassariella vexata]|uniref:Uncharacterized protein n=1 Tax=Pseudomassariella vexata TaxID=1141098 RepID=A0A1Y2DT11_9PEZI|nr:uncharacterized protein BCR38DRAFT_410830 [Pseudomassariella vexata]ORY62412.1 hypothetical protein BCR38DRAFT_410830 [Pseudomassariella vexata]